MASRRSRVPVRESKSTWQSIQVSSCGIYLYGLPRPTEVEPRNDAIVYRQVVDNGLSW